MRANCLNYIHSHSGPSQLHPRCQRAPLRLAEYLPQYGKKWFKKEALTCTFCFKKGHAKAFCPLTPTRKQGKACIPFVEKLLSLPRVRSIVFSGLAKEDGLMMIRQQGKTLNEGNPWAESQRIYDRLRANLGYWKALGASNSVISWLGYGVPMRFQKEPRYLAFQNHRMDPEAAAYVDRDMEKHKSTGCFVVAPPGSAKIVNPILAIQQDGKWRRCDDCRFGNAFQANCEFKMASLERDIPILTEEGDVGITRDLEKAYYKVPLDVEAQPFCAFDWLGIIYFSMVMLFGMCQAPLYFTRICKPMAAFFGAVKIPALNYIDDWFWSAKPGLVPELCRYLQAFFELLGWSFNDKGKEGTEVKLLGFVLDLVRRRFVVPMEKRVATLNILKEHALAGALGQPIATVPLQSTMGKVVAMALAIPAVKVWCRALFSQIVGATNVAARSLILTPTAREELEMLVTLLTLTEGSPFVHPATDIDIWVDSGEAGWGAHTEGQQANGWFEAEWIGRSSTARELKGLTMALRALADGVRGKVIRLNMDSMCAVRNIVKGGGPVPELCALVKEVWALCKGLGAQLVPRWQRRNEAGMVLADTLSKVGTKWTLRADFTATWEAGLGMEVHMPDVADAKATVARVVKSQAKTALVLPRWEGQPWWKLVQDNAHIYALGQAGTVVAPNEYGWPRWDLVLAEFN